MGNFVNPGNDAFRVALASSIYVDKTGLLEYTNKVTGTLQAYICNSRPRRFGKSITANMLTAYYSKGCDSETIFADLEIGKSPDFKKHLNQYDVIHLGYLAYDQDKERAFIPNEEVRMELIRAAKRRKWDELTDLDIKNILISVIVNCSLIGIFLSSVMYLSSYRNINTQNVKLD